MLQFFRNIRVLIGATIVSIVLLVVIVCLSLLVFPEVINDQVDKNVRLDEGTEQWDRFKKLPFDINFKVYFFNLTNPDEVLIGMRPIVEEVGPFVYGEAREKNIHEFDDENDTVIYEQMEQFAFNEEASGWLKSTDLVTVVNAPLMTLIQELENSTFQNSIGKCVERIFHENPSIFVTKSVHDLLFEGSVMCDSEVPADPNCSGLILDIVYGTACAIAQGKKNIESRRRENNSTYLSFSYFNYKNGKSDGVYEVNRGRDDVSKLGHIMKLNHNDSLNLYEGEDRSCDEVRGTDSTIYQPRIGKDETLTILNTDICRKVEIFYAETDTFKGIEGYVFVPRKDMLYSDKGEDDCYCTKNVKNIHGETECYLDGVSDLYPCVGAPILLSFPHFLWADEKYTKNYSKAQINPIEKDHRIYLHVEPNTGTPLRGGKRVQLNMPLRPINKIAITENLPRIVLPILWVDEGFELPDDYVDVLNDLYFSKVKIVDGVKYALIALFSLMTLVFGGLCVKVKFFTRNNK